MNDATKLIERMENETGQRFEENDMDNHAVAGLFGALARAIGTAPETYTEREDIAAGVMIRHMMSAQYRREKETMGTFAMLIAGGMSPEDAKALLS